MKTTVCGDDNAMLKIAICDDTTEERELVEQYARRYFQKQNRPVELQGARQQMIIAARAAGVQCWDTVFTNLDAMDVFEEEVKMIKMMGFDGKSLVNPRQIDVVHKIFTPTQKEIIFAEKVVKEIDEKKALGIGVFTVDGKMIDIAFYDGAKRTIALAKASGVYEGDL